jgi:ABC-2 type transport system permease protein
VRSVLIIFRRELAAYLTSPVAYLIAFAVLLMSGFLFNNDLALRNGREATSSAVILSYFALFTIFFAPLLTMRLFAEENREGRLELLMTLPVRDGDLVLGKFLGAWGYYTLLLALTLIYQVALIWLSPPDLGVAFSNYLGLWLMGGATIAVGMIFSALNENQIVAAFLTLAALILLWSADQVGQVITSREVASVVRSFSFQTNFVYSFSIGIVRLDSVVFFVSVIAVALFITTQIIESRRWR